MEGEILRGLVRSRIVPSATSARLEVASRTDRGVSAVGNALALTSSLGPDPLLRAVNGLAPDIFFTALRAVPESFRVRSATRRVYRYFEPGATREFATWPATARRFVGRIDVRSLGRALPAADPTWRTIESITVHLRPGGAMVEVAAPSFVWGMVRKIVAALREVGAGRVPVDRLEAALRGRTRLTFPMAEAERLVLWDVEYPIPWEYRWNGPNRHQSRWEKVHRDDLWARRALLEMFATENRPVRERDGPRSESAPKAG